MAKVQNEEDEFDFEGNRDETTFLVHMLAGSIAGLMEHVAIYPADTIKVSFYLKRHTCKQLVRKQSFLIL